MAEPEVRRFGVTKYSDRDLTPFDVARILGMSGLEALSHAHTLESEWSAADQTAQSEAWQQTFATAGSSLSRRNSIGELVEKALFRSAILFQASMEGVLFDLAHRDEDVQAAIGGNDRFKDRWVNALTALDITTNEFERYHDSIYRAIRIPLVHPDKDQKIEAINRITFRSVYCGIRQGWWAQARLIERILGGRSCPESWEFICSGAELDPLLFPEELPEP